MYNTWENGKVVLNDLTYFVITKEKTPTIFRQKLILFIIKWSQGFLWSSAFNLKVLVLKVVNQS